MESCAHQGAELRELEEEARAEIGSEERFGRTALDARRAQDASARRDEREQRREQDVVFLARYLVRCPPACSAVTAMAAAGFSSGAIARAFVVAFEAEDSDQQVAS